MSYIFIDEHGTVVGIKDNCISIKYTDGMVKSVPVENVDGIYMFSSSQLTAQCVMECFGKLQSTGHINVQRQRKQVHLYETAFSIELSKRIIVGKIHNQEIVLKRYARSEKKSVDDLTIRMRNCMDNVKRGKTIDEIMGYEGRAAKLYFEGLSRLVHEEFKFNGRSKRPPLDEFNSMLSLGYSILMNEVYGMLENKGLNPYFGFMHSDKEKHPTLASDMMEEWRAIIVDSLVMSLVNGHEIHKEHFYHDLDCPGYYLTKEGLSIFLKKYDRKLRTVVNYLTYIDYSVSFRRSIDLQINELTKAIEEGDASLYTPIWLR